MGDFVAQFRRPESGIHTVEGNVAGSRAAELTKKRQKDQLAFEEKKRQRLHQHHSAGSKVIQNKFASNTTLSLAEQQFQAQTVGLVTAEEFKRAARIQKGEIVQGEDPFHPNNESQNNSSIEKAHLRAESCAEKDSLEQESKLESKVEKRARKKRLVEKKKMMSSLSFASEEENDFLLLDKGHPMNKEFDTNERSMKFTRKSLKDPTVDTSFLPDKNREEEELMRRTQLALEWQREQEIVREEKLEIVYSYWDGSGHRRTVECRKGDTIGAFLELVRQDLCREFRELTSIGADALLYIKEDLIIPQDLTFYDLIVTKARGKSGPLFHFDVHDDIRIGAIDSRVEKDESHPGKVVERRWYDRNKHIFPASRWELFDPTKDYGTYTIHGKEVTKK